MGLVNGRNACEIGVERWLLCGQSFGAALTLRYALTHPDRVMAQVFTNSSAALADAEWIKARRASAAQQAEEIERDGHAALACLRVHPSHAIDVQVCFRNLR